MLQRINDALPGLVLGIIVYGVIVELAGVWFVTDKVRYTTGLLIGISLACGMAVNIATVLRDAVELYGEDNAKKKIVAKSLLRYAVVVIVFFVMMKWNLGNLITAFIGVDVDQSVESDTVITSAMKKLNDSVYNAVASYYDKSFEGGKSITLSAADDGVQLPMETSKFEKFTKEEYEKVYSGLKDGSIKIANDT